MKTTKYRTSFLHRYRFMSTCKTVHLKKHCDEGLPSGEHFEIIETKVNPADVADGDICVQALVMSVDPYLRGGIKTGRGTHHLTCLPSLHLPFSPFSTSLCTSVRLNYHQPNPNSPRQKPWRRHVWFYRRKDLGLKKQRLGSW